MAQNIKKIYLHWSATHYDWAEPGHYHTVVSGNGSVKRLTGYDQPLSAHTASRNQESVALCIACMGGRGWQDFPPTAVQIENLCKEVALLALKLGWKPDDITPYRVLTHAEAAANRDFPIEKVRQVSGWNPPTSTPQGNDYLAKARKLGLPHENYGPATWFDRWPGGFVERWDLWQLKPGDQEGEGGLIVRNKIKKYLSQMAVPEVDFSSSTTNKPNQSKIYLGSKLIGTGYLLSDQRCYVRIGGLTSVYGIKTSWNNEFRYVNLLTDKFKPRYLANSPLIIGYPAVDVYLNRPEDGQGEPIIDAKFPVRPFMQGIVIDNVTHVLLADFCNELGIPFTFQSSDSSIRLSPAPS